MTYTIEKVTTLIGARRYGDNDTNIGFILTDSRSLCFPEETLFFALKSERNDGHNYIPELYRRGVKNFVVTDVPKGYASDYPEANFLKVVNTLEALQRLAERIVMNSISLSWVLRVPMARRWSRSGSISCSRQACSLPAALAVTILR